MTYCSRACQKEDLLNGHEKACCKSYTDNKSGKFQGRVWPRVLPESERATALLQDLEINLTMVQLKVCLDNMELILGQTNSLDTPLYDCVVQFDLRACPPVVAVIKYTNYFARSDLREGFEKTRTKDTFTCIYTVSIHSRDTNETAQPSYLQMQRLFPVELFKNSSSRQSEGKSATVHNPEIIKGSNDDKGSLRKQYREFLQRRQNHSQVGNEK